MSYTITTLFWRKLYQISNSKARYVPAVFEKKMTEGKLYVWRKGTNEYNYYYFVKTSDHVWETPEL